ncbi:MAG: molybdopterin converting factor subunit 1 [Pirellulaceae bacterium]|jgi:molybdopterin converting factor subunit 1
MKISVRLFAAVRDSLGQSEVSVDLPDGATVAILRTTLQQQYPDLETLFARAIFAIKEEYARDDTTLNNDETVACIPPVSGG